MEPKARRSWPGWMPGIAFAVAACGGSDGGTGPGNRSPTAVIQANPIEVAENDNHQTVVTLNGSGSTDPDGDALTYFWEALEAVFVNSTSATSQVANVTFPGTAPYPVTLTVNDGNGGTDQAETTILLGPPANQNPVAIIMANPIMVPPNDNHATIVVLDGSQSFDPDGDPIEFEWRVINGTFRNNTSASSDVAEVSFPGIAPYGVTLTVRDDRGGVGEAQTTILVGVLDR